MVLEGAFEDGAGGKEVDAFAFEFAVEEVAHVDVTVAAVEDSFSLLDLGVVSVPSDVSCAVDVLFFEDSGQE